MARCHTVKNELKGFRALGAVYSAVIAALITSFVAWMVWKEFWLPVAITAVIGLDAAVLCGTASVLLRRHWKVDARRVCAIAGASASGLFGGAVAVVLIPGDFNWAVEWHFLPGVILISAVVGLLTGRLLGVVLINVSFVLAGLSLAWLGKPKNIASDGEENWRPPHT